MIMIPQIIEKNFSKMGLFVLIILYVLPVVISLDSWHKNHSLNLYEFFNETYIEKMKGAWDFKKKYFKSLFDSSIII